MPEDELSPVTQENLVNVSVVRYEQPFEEIEAVVAILRQTKIINQIYIVDNSANEDKRFKELSVQYIFNSSNLGFGKAHNIAIRKSIDCDLKYHIVLNSDTVFAPEIFEVIVAFLNENESVGALMPKVIYPNGDIQYLCKLLPTPIDLLFRRFVPDSWTRKRARQFQLIDSGYNQIMNVPYLSGCFLVLRMEALKEVGLFDEQFFLYPEDIDLSRRIYERYKTLFFPNVSIVHVHRQGSYKSLKLLWIHIVNLIRYFNKWGWIFDAKRKQINRATLEQIAKLLKQNKL